jgi:GDP-L-fucose synthase
MDKHSKIYVAGHRGLVGSAILRRLLAEGYSHLITRSRHELDLTDRAAVDVFFAEQRPDYVFLAAAKVGGIHANHAYAANFIRDNIYIQTNVIDAARRFGTIKLAFLGSSCIYPKYAPQPMPESCLLTGELEPTNQWYAVAKIAGIKLCQAYRLQHGFNAISIMPTNLYGPLDNFHPENSHVIPGLLRRFHEAKLADLPCVSVWGSGTPRREFMHVDDLADASLFLMREYDDSEIINVGTGSDLTISELAKTVKNVTGYSGSIRFDASRPDGTPQKLLDVSRLTKLGWRARIKLQPGLADTYRWYTSHVRDQDVLQSRLLNEPSSKPPAAPERSSAATVSSL